MQVDSGFVMSRSMIFSFILLADIARVYTIYEYLHENRIENTWFYIHEALCIKVNEKSCIFSCMGVVYVIDRSKAKHVFKKWQARSR